MLKYWWAGAGLIFVAVLLTFNVHDDAEFVANIWKITGLGLVAVAIGGLMDRNK